MGNAFRVMFLNIHDNLMRQIETFEKTTVKYGFTEFTLTEPVTSTVYQMYFRGLVDYQVVNGNRWNVFFNLEEEV